VTVRPLGLVAAVLTACEPNVAPIHNEPRPDAYFVPRPECMPPADLCSITCGNGVIEYCHEGPVPGGAGCNYYPRQEECEGNETRPCTDLGYLNAPTYYGGTATCSACTLDESTCEVCPPTLQCVTAAPFEISGGVVASGARVAIASYNEGLAIFEGTTEIARVALVGTEDVLAAPNGWFVLAGDTNFALYTVGLDGQLGAPVPLNIEYYAVAYGGGLLLFVDAEQDPNTGDKHLYTTILDTTANVTVPRTDLGTISFGAEFAVTSDGTSFSSPPTDDYSTSAPMAPTQ